MNFQREPVTRELCAEMFPLFELHYAEIAHYQDIQLAPDVDRLLLIDQSGALRMFTARADDGTLCGYAAFFIQNNLYCSSSLQALQAAIFIHPKSRGEGMRLVSWCDEQLKLEGVQVVYHHSTAGSGFGKKLALIGYECVDHVFSKRLN